jgi:hypothetical protein
MLALKTLLIYHHIKKYKDENSFACFGSIKCDAPITLNGLKVDWTQAVFKNSNE